MTVEPFSLRDAPALIERLLPVQKLSMESYREQKAGRMKTLTGLGNFWKGRKPLILAKACILGCLLPATNDSVRDLEIFEMLMGMDDASFVLRVKQRPKPRDVISSLSLSRIADYFDVSPEGVLPPSAPVDLSDPKYSNVKVEWRNNLPGDERLKLESQVLPSDSYYERAKKARRPEEVADIHDHIWDDVNSHLGTNARSFPHLIEQLGIMRFGHRPRIADTFCGSGQIPFEAARLGCDVFASDLNPIASMLAWGAINIVGGSAEDRIRFAQDQRMLVGEIQKEIDQLDIETDGNGWRTKAFLYCLEARCPQTGWMVPLLPTRIVSKSRMIVADLVPDPVKKRYDIIIRTGASELEMELAENGTIESGGRGQDPYLVHTVEGVKYRIKISGLRGDYRRDDGVTGNRLRPWDRNDIVPRPDDIFQERLYCVQWVLSKQGSGRDVYEFRTVTPDDIMRERIVEDFVSNNLNNWQEKGWLPDMRIEPGEKTNEPIRTRGWTYWHHLFNPRQLLLAGLYNKCNRANSKFALTQILNFNSRLSPWSTANIRIAHDGSNKQVGGATDSTANTFYNQALNTLYMYGCRASLSALPLAELDIRSYPIDKNREFQISARPCESIDINCDIFITDPPYGDAVKYEEILEFFIAWLRKNPPLEFAEWIWDSRRSLAIKGEDEGFRRGMVGAYKRMTECMPDKGIQVIMFTHQSGRIWADMANIVWASGLQVTAAWYVATETDSAMDEGSYVKGTVLLVCRKRLGTLKTSRDDLAWELQEEVEAQVADLVGLNQKAKGFYRDENVFEDADIQMAGYAAALRVLTSYSTIDGRDMTTEAVRPRVKGETTFVDSLIEFAVSTANQCLVPQGIEKRFWDRLGPAERFYLVMLDQESRGAKKLDNYQNFAKAFKVREFRDLMGSQKANSARLKSAVEFGKDEMREGSELYQTVLRAVLYGVMELVQEVDGNDVLAHLTLNIPDYYADLTQREMAAALAGYLAHRLEGVRPEEASAARVLRELVKSQRLG